jgi:metallo-beta-lactamase class B
MLWLPSPAFSVPPDEHPIACAACEGWNAPRAPVQLAAHTWFVGPAGLSVVAVRTEDGLVLLDAALPQSVDLLWANLAAAGLDPTELRWVLTSHPHFDHVGGAAAIQRRSGATVVAGPRAEAALRAGTALADDPQADTTGEDSAAFPAVTGPIRALADGETLEVGGVRFRRVATPGHTPDGSSWTWDDTDAAGGLLHLVFADSLNPVSSEAYRFGDHREAFESSIRAIHDLPCDLLIPVHPSFGGFDDRARRAASRGPAAWVDPNACTRYADDAAKRLRARLRKEARAG